MLRTCMILVLALSTRVACGDTPTQTFTYHEPFGLSHRNEILEFDLQQPMEAGACRLLDDKGREVPCQIARNGKKLLLRTNLAALMPFPYTLSSPNRGFPTLQEVEPAPAIKVFLQVIEDVGVAADPPYLVLREPEDQASQSKSTKHRARKKGGGSAK